MRIASSSCGRSSPALDLRSAYVVTDGVKTVWALAGMRSHRCQSANGFNICTPVATGGEESRWPRPRLRPTLWGQAGELNFTDAGDTARYRTSAGEMRLLLARGRRARWPWCESACSPPTCRAATPDCRWPGVRRAAHPRSSVDIVVNGQTVDQWTFRSTNPASRRQARIPARALAGRRWHRPRVPFPQPRIPALPSARAPDRVPRPQRAVDDYYGRLIARMSLNMSRII